LRMHYVMGMGRSTTFRPLVADLSNAENISRSIFGNDRGEDLYQTFAPQNARKLIER
jgi:hypothetical protein